MKRQTSTVFSQIYVHFGAREQFSTSNQEHNFIFRDLINENDWKDEFALWRLNVRKLDGSLFVKVTFETFHKCVEALIFWNDNFGKWTRQHILLGQLIKQDDKMLFLLLVWSYFELNRFYRFILVFSTQKSYDILVRF